MNETASNITRCVIIRTSTFAPHLALVFGSQGLDELLHAERSPHQNRDPLERSDESADVKHASADSRHGPFVSYLPDPRDVGLHVGQDVAQT